MKKIFIFSLIFLSATAPTSFANDREFVDLTPETYFEALDQQIYSSNEVQSACAGSEASFSMKCWAAIVSAKRKIWGEYSTNLSTRIVRKLNEEQRSPYSRIYNDFAAKWEELKKEETWWKRQELLLDLTQRHTIKLIYLLKALDNPKKKEEAQFLLKNLASLSYQDATDCYDDKAQCRTAVANLIVQGRPNIKRQWKIDGINIHPTCFSWPFEPLDTWEGFAEESKASSVDLLWANIPWFLARDKKLLERFDPWDLEGPGGDIVAVRPIDDCLTLFMEDRNLEKEPNIEIVGDNVIFDSGLSSWEDIHQYIVEGDRTITHCRDAERMLGFRCLDAKSLSIRQKYVYRRYSETTNYTGIFGLFEVPEKGLSIIPLKIQEYSVE